jgi:hypothetical protein
MSDNVSHPNHYNHGGLECFDALRAALGDKYMGFLIGNVIKYCWRYEHKNGIEDLQKARAYIDEAINEMQSKQEACLKTGKEVAEQIPERGKDNA